MFIMQLGRNIPWTTMTSTVFCFGHLNRKKGRNCSWTKIPRPIFCEKNHYQLLNCGRYADGCSPLEVVSHPICLCRSALIQIFFQIHLISMEIWKFGNLDYKNTKLLDAQIGALVFSPSYHPNQHGQLNFHPDSVWDPAFYRISPRSPENAKNRHSAGGSTVLPQLGGLLLVSKANHLRIP